MKRSAEEQTHSLELERRLHEQGARRAMQEDPVQRYADELERGRPSFGCVLTIGFHNRETKMNSDTPQSQDPIEYVPIESFLTMTAMLLGHIHAIEATLCAIISRRDDAETLERHVDAILLHDEASRIATNNTPDETMQTHEWARQAAFAIFRNANTSRDVT